jgi:GTP cyclohydrolase II
MLSTSRDSETSSVSDVVGQAHLRYSRGEWENARRLYLRALSTLTDISNPHFQLKADIHRCLGNIGLRVSDPESAQLHFLEAIPIFASDPSCAKKYADCLKGLGNAIFCAGDYRFSRRFFIAGEKLYAKLGVLERQAACLRSIADVDILFRDEDSAHHYFEKAKPIFQAGGSEVGVASCISGFGEVAFFRNDLVSAKHHFLEARSIYERHDAAWARAFVTRQLGRVAMAEDRFDEAEQYLEEAAKLSALCQNDLERGHCFKDLSSLHAATRNASRAEEYAGLSNELYQKCKFTDHPKLETSEVRVDDEEWDGKHPLLRIRFLRTELLSSDNGAESNTPDLKIKCCVRSRLGGPFGEAFIYIYRNNRDSKLHHAVVFEGPDTRVASRSLNEQTEDKKDLATRISRSGDYSRVTLIKPDKDVLVRLHSSCLTGEVMLSGRCDCREMLHSAMKKLNEYRCDRSESTDSKNRRASVLIYMDQEGRGIGLVSKLRGFNLQDVGGNDKQAARLLGHKEDERSYDIAAAILRDLGLGADDGHHVSLMTGSSSKISELKENGVNVVTIVPF